MATARLRASLPADRLIFTSPAAAEWAIELAGDEGFRAGVAVAPGPGTAERLIAAGLTTVVWPRRGGTSEDVLALPELSNVDGLSVVILAAPGGRQLIHRTLEHRGATVTRVNVYRRLPLPPTDEFLELLDGGRPPVTLISSAGALDHLAGEMNDSQRKCWLDGDFVVSSERLAARCRELGAHRIVVAGGADDEALVAALDQTND